VNESYSVPINLTEVPSEQVLEISTAENVSDLTVMVSSSSTVATDKNDVLRYCPSGLPCDQLSYDCIQCDFNNTCVYGRNTSVSCQPKPQVDCVGERNFSRLHNCQYCYQTPHWLHVCTHNTTCRVNFPPEKYQANCSVKEDVVCLGQRRFHKLLPCNWTSGKRWSVALILSITLGGFGADRFYLGMWREGIGKLFSFGGLGVWTLVDVVLVATGYIGPNDGSLYI